MKRYFCAQPPKWLPTWHEEVCVEIVFVSLPDDGCLGPAEGRDDDEPHAQAGHRVHPVDHPNRQAGPNKRDGSIKHVRHGHGGQTQDWDGCGVLDPVAYLQKNMGLKLCVKFDASNVLKIAKTYKSCQEWSDKVGSTEEQKGHSDLILGSPGRVFHVRLQHSFQQALATHNHEVIKQWKED